MFCDWTDRSNADSRSETGFDKAEVTFCLVPEMPLWALIFDDMCLCAHCVLQLSSLCVSMLLYGILTCKSVQCACTFDFSCNILY